MGELQELHNHIAYQLALFSAGIPIGIGVFVIEMSAFVENLIAVTVFKTLPSSEIGDLFISNYYFVMFLITIFGIIQGIALGWLKNLHFHLGI
jgi:hypothetical protein